MTKRPLNHQRLLLRFCLPMLLICSPFTLRSKSKGSILLCGNRECVSVSPQRASERAWQQGTVLSGRETGPHPHRLSQKNTGEDDIFFSLWFVGIVVFVSHLPQPQSPSVWLAGTGPSSPSASPATSSSALCPSTPVLSSENRVEACGPTADQSERRAVLWLLPFLGVLYFESAAVGRVSSFFWPLVGQGRVKSRGRVTSPPCRVC